MVIPLIEYFSVATHEISPYVTDNTVSKSFSVATHEISPYVTDNTVSKSFSVVPSGTVDILGNTNSSVFKKYKFGINRKKPNIY